MGLKLGRGWHGESYRHSLASRGIKSGVTPRITKIDKKVSGYAKRFSEGVKIERKEHPNLSQESVEQLVRDHLDENPDYYGLTVKNNPVELRGQQLSIRVLKPKSKARYRTHDVGRKGRLQLVLMDGKVQSYKMNLSHYPNKEMVFFEIDNLNLSSAEKIRAKSVVSKWFK